MHLWNGKGEKKESYLFHKEFMKQVKELKQAYLFHEDS
ncbi:hypothetical protein J2S74_004264 [Evansella vedderi]|uniref:Uncharacterized protein n=1 Tax=Evansella vedderi TaxID=38282 RepID=A0ABU0A1F8_9BACI|nr:hypothetical protein [Evansella vedderi]